MIETKFKNTEIGPIPMDWEVKTLGEMFDIGSSKRIMQSQWTNRGIPFLRAREIVSIFNKDEFAQPIFISQELYESLNEKYGVPKIKDILVTGVGTLGIPYLIQDNQPFYYKDGNIICLSSKDMCHSNYIYLQFLYDIIKNQINSDGVGSTVGTFTINRAKSIKTPVPPLAEQEAIGLALLEVDELIEGLKKLVAKKRAIKQGAMSQLLSGKSRLPGFSEPWKEVTLGEIGNLLPNNSLSWEFLTGGSSIRNIHYGQILTRFGAIVDVSKTDLPIICKSLEQKFLKSNIAQEGDIVFADTAEDDTVGKAIELVNIEDKRVVSGLHTFWYRPKTKFAPRFLGYALNCSIFHSQIPPLATGTKVSSISKPNLLKLTLCYPTSYAEQEAIAKVLTDMDAEIEALSRKVAKYEQVKQGMMQQLLTGKIRLV